MKRMILTSLGLLLLGTSVALAQQPPAPTTPPAGQSVGPNFVDANGDGICDNLQARQGAGRQGVRRGRGPGDGTGNNGIGPKDGTGYGAGRGAGVCTGTCTGTGQARGSQRRGGRG